MRRSWSRRDRQSTVASSCAPAIAADDRIIARVIMIFIPEVLLPE
jgi:hypothetical protein